MNEIRTSVDAHLREGLYLLSVGRVIESRREWRKALELEPEHAEAADYILSTDDELSDKEKTSEQEEIERVAAGGSIEPEPSSQGWVEDEVTSEVSGRWRKQSDVEHAKVTPPGEGAEQNRSWELEAEVGWDSTEPPLEGETSRPQSFGDKAVGGDEGWLDATQAGEGGDSASRSTDDPTPRDATGGGFQADTVEGLLGRAVSEFHDGDYKAAREHLNALLRLDPGNSAAESYIDQLDARLREQLHKGAIPERTIGMDEVEGIQLDLVGGYVVSLIDGHTTVDDIFALSSHLDENEVTRILVNLLEQGIIRTREA